MLLWTLIFCYLIPIHSKRSVCAVVSGSTGVLGSALVKKFSRLQWTTYAGYRCEQKVQESLLNDGNIHAIRLVNLDGQSSKSLLPCVTEDFNHFVLVNNAACYLKGNSLEALRKSIDTNVLLPLKLINEFIPLTKNMEKMVTIVNISSGDGELVYLHSKLASELQLLSSMAEFESWIMNLFAQYNPSFEYAHGIAPMYSLSKAVLNCLTRIVHNQYTRQPNIRIVACCPGNFLSPMTSVDELKSIRNVDDVVKDIVEIIVEKENFPGGRFYRFGQQINW